MAKIEKCIVCEKPLEKRELTLEKKFKVSDISKISFGGADNSPEVTVNFKVVFDECINCGLTYNLRK